MKKFMVLMLVGLLLVSVSSAFAQNGRDPMAGLIDKHGGTVSQLGGPSSSIKINAEVGKYACIGWVNAEKLSFVGRANEVKEGEAKFRVESNCNVLVKVDGVPFYKQIGKERFTLKSYMKVGNGNGWREMKAGYNEKETAKPSPVGRGITTYSVKYKAQLGRVSDQPAGEYQGQLIATVYAADYGNR
ncbi:MAG TPA: hypothetical protein PLC07_04175 [Bacillota bacterium]|nr:hypothetical protein [Bacillota bacterium]HPT88613.1 hypothetical protein [Bacillota bacterium]